MPTVRELLNVTRHALDNYSEVQNLEILAGSDPFAAACIAQRSAMRKATEELTLLLEGEECDL